MVVGSLGDLFEIYVRHDFGERADLTLRYPDPADEHTAPADIRSTSWACGAHELDGVGATENAPVLAWSLSTVSKERLRPNWLVFAKRASVGVTTSRWKRAASE